MATPAGDGYGAAGGNGGHRGIGGSRTGTKMDIAGGGGFFGALLQGNGCRSVRQGEQGAGTGHIFIDRNVKHIVAIQLGCGVALIHPFRLIDRSVQTGHILMAVLGLCRGGAGVKLGKVLGVLGRPRSSWC